MACKRCIILPGSKIVSKCGDAIKSDPNKEFKPAQILKESKKEKHKRVYKKKKINTEQEIIEDNNGLTGENYE